MDLPDITINETLKTLILTMFMIILQTLMLSAE